MKHIKATIIGRVQGVYFRASTKEAAQHLGICGFVKNQEDGSVRLEAQGEDQAIEKFCEWLKQGPPAARVEELIIEAGSANNFNDFVIR